MDKCQICGQESQDLRTLRLSYLYQISEINPTFEMDSNGFYRITTCKDCRGEFLGMLGHWATGAFVAGRNPLPHQNIPVSVNGRVVMMSPEEWKAHTAKQGEPDRPPMVLKNIYPEEV